MILSAISLLMFDHSVFGSISSAELDMSRFIVSVLDEEAKNAVKTARLAGEKEHKEDI
jgi:hypothetical protein